MGRSHGDHEAVAHVLAIPSALHGHIVPMFRFTSQLARKGITVSFVCFEESIPRLTSSRGSASSELQGLNFVTLQGTPNLATGTAPEAEKMLKEAFEPLMERFTREKSVGIAGPTCIISDMYLSWTLDAAAKLGIPRYGLVTSGVTWARFMQGSIDYFESGQFQASETDGKLVEFDWPICISGIPPLYHHELGSPRRFAAAFRLRAESLMKSAGVLVNSFYELEEKVVEVFRNPGKPGDEGISVPKIYPIGPLFSTTVLTGSSSVYGLEDSRGACMRWLDSQPSSSVLYVAFGSGYRLRPDQRNELAYGLEASNQRFLWVCPLEKIYSEAEETPSITEVLPPGFEARVGDRGCIVTGWAPQLEILAHSSTGGFLTHSGWNSTLESVIFGVPMISWPQSAEQPLNGKYMAGDLKIAVQLPRGKENNVERDEVERAVRLLLVDSEGTAMKSRAEELKRKAAVAMAEGGSQQRFFQEFVDDISR